MAFKRALKPCSGCGGKKPVEIGKGRRLCPSCREERDKRKRCIRCGGPKNVSGCGKRLCENCAPVRPRYKPCLECGSSRPKMKGAHVCEDCAEIVEWRNRTRREAKKMLARNACDRCRRSKRQGAGTRYCNACRAEVTAEQNAPRSCICCGERRVIKKHAKACDTCRYISDERKKKRQRDYAAKRRAERIAHGIPRPQSKKPKKPPARPPFVEVAPLQLFIHEMLIQIGLAELAKVVEMDESWLRRVRDGRQAKIRADLADRIFTRAGRPDLYAVNYAA